VNFSASECKWMTGKFPAADRGGGNSPAPPFIHHPLYAIILLARCGVRSTSHIAGDRTPNYCLRKINIDTAVNLVLLISSYSWTSWVDYSVASKKTKPLYRINSTKSYFSVPMRLDFILLKLKFQTSTVMLLFGVKYSLHGLICDVNYCA